MIADIITVAVVALFAFIGFRRGIASSLLNLAVVIASSLGARYLSSVLSEGIYNAFVKQTIIQNLNTLITESGVSYAVSNCFDAVPDWLRLPALLVAGLFGADTGDLSRAAGFTDFSAETAAAAIEEPLGTVVTGVLSLILTSLLFIVFLVLAKLLTRAALKVFDIPVLRGINRFFGLIVGLIEGIVVVWLAINLFCVIMTYANPTLLEQKLWFGELFKFMCVFV